VSFRLRLILGFLAVMTVPLALLAVGVRREVTGRLTDQYARRIGALAADVGARFGRESDAIARRLASIREALADDPRFRLAAVQRVPEQRPYLLDYADGAMRAAGLDYFQIQDREGRILTSGHFRAEYDRLDPTVPDGLVRLAGAPAVIRARTPDGGFLAVARVDSLRVGDVLFLLVGGIAAPRLLAGLTSESDLVVAVVLPDTAVATDSVVAAALDSVQRAAGDPAAWLARSRLVQRGPDLAAVDPAGAIAAGQVLIAYPTAPLGALLRGVDRWFLVAGLATAAVAAALALVLSAAASRPLQSLAKVAESIDLERADLTFASHRSDEVGVLARLLGSMMSRLRSDAARLREAERRAAVGDLARQVNHDVKNGLAPVRNVFRHLDEVARDQPERLAGVFRERRGTIESGITYLERLAGNYARLAPTVGWQVCDVGALVREVAAGAGSGSALVRVETAAMAPLRTDPLALRRIVENLVRNAVESFGEGITGEVSLSTEAAPPGVRIRVRDTGRGMTREDLDRAFEPFYTTKPTGSGLGLSIVRRLVADLGGTLKVTSEPGRGTEAIVDLPAGKGA
jgi:signal transduction histidine kinase